MGRNRRTYNLSERTIQTIRELSERYSLDRSQDAVVELAVEDLERRLRDAEEARVWAAAAEDPDFRREAEDTASQTRRLVEPFHRSGLMTGCPITAAIAAGEAGQTRAGVIMTSQVRTISARRIRSEPLGIVLDVETRSAVRRALAQHLGLDVPGILDGAA